MLSILVYQSKVADSQDSNSNINQTWTRRWSYKTCQQVQSSSPSFSPTKKNHTFCFSLYLFSHEKFQKNTVFKFCISKSNMNVLVCLLNVVAVVFIKPNSLKIEHSAKNRPAVLYWYWIICIDRVSVCDYGLQGGAFFHQLRGPRDVQKEGEGGGARALLKAVKSRATGILA